MMGEKAAAEPAPGKQANEGKHLHVTDHRRSGEARQRRRLTGEREGDGLCEHSFNVGLVSSDWLHVT
ncbi:MAG: hypothetical protein ACPIOQ_59560, partial [Promethearchaeia archaeon]